MRTVLAVVAFAFTSVAAVAQPLAPLSPPPPAGASGRIPMIRIHTVAGVEIATGERHFSKRAQTLEFGSLIHLSSENGVSGSSRQSTAGSAVGASRG